MSAHTPTPGPWKWDGNPCEYDASNEAPWLVTDAYAAGTEKDRRMGVILQGQIECLSEANARLIEAAPEMLDALRQWQAAERDGDALELANARKSRDAAIAKAKGGAE